MPVISRFYGMIVAMHFLDHPPPHFHVRYGEYRAAIGVDPPRLLAGDLPPRALGLVVEWARIHRRELLEKRAAPATRRAAETRPAAGIG